MKRLYLLRHAKSSWDDPHLDDFDRPLNKRGQQAAKGMGEAMKSKDYRPDIVLCSTAARALETRDRALPAFGQEIESNELKTLYLASPSRIIAALQRVDDSHQSALVIGHNPGLEVLARRLAGPGSPRELLKDLEFKFPTAALAVFDIGIDRWSDLDGGKGKLIAFLKPRDLKAA